MKSWDRYRNAVIALGILLAYWPCAFALDPSLDVSQYAHTSWKVSDGFVKGAIRALAQTPDGYLWLGTEFGLSRFDGVRAVPWQAPAEEYLTNTDIRSLQAARDGRLWIGTFNGLASLKNGKLTHYPQLDGQVIESLLEDREGTIWVAGWSPSVGKLCRIESGNIQCFGEDGRLGSGVTSLYEDSSGNLWVGAMNGLWRWKPGAPKLYPMPDPAERIYALVESDDGGLLVAKHSGITKLRNGRREAYPLPAGLEFKPHRLLRDLHGGLWIGALVDKGLLHIHEGNADLFNRNDGMAGNSVSSFLQDREGNIWVATVDGLDRFRDFAVPTFSDRQGLSGQGVFSILAARDGSLWLGTSEGLDRWNNGQIKVYRSRQLRGLSGSSSISGLTAATGTHLMITVREIADSRLPTNDVESLFQDDRGNIWVGTQHGIAILKADRFVPIPSVPYGVVYGFADDGAESVWISHQDGLFHLFRERVVERILWAKLGRREPANALIHDAVRGGLWLGFRDGGIAYFKDGQIRASYSGAEGLGEGMVRDLYTDRQDTLWAASDGGLSRIKDGRVLTLTSQSGLPCDVVHWMRDDNASSVWLYTACGLVRIARFELETWVSNPKSQIHPTVFDSSDGVGMHRYTSGYETVVAKSLDGRLWFLPIGGVSVIDPRNLHTNKLPPPVHVEQINADGKTYDASNGLRLPPNVKDLAIDYTALSFVAPEKVQVRVKLEGQDNDWRVPVNTRHAHYTNLPPKHYRFRVIASNNSGVWNEEGATLEFVIPPALYQTNWFRSLCAAVFLALLWALHQLRLHQQARQFTRTLEARVGERTRIARELHDTLLQSFHGLLFRFQSVSQLLPERPLDAKQRLDSTIDQAAEAITEARDAVQGLRSSTVITNELALTLKTLGEELALNEATPTSPRLRLEVFGTPRELHPIVRDEIYRIAAEGLHNAFRHAHAEHIELELHYDPRELRLRVRDDGKGIDPQVLAGQGKGGHYGLPGMHERAKLVSGKLGVWSELDAGTEIELTVPSANAYTKLGLRGSWRKRFSQIGKEKEKDVKIES